MRDSGSLRLIRTELQHRFRITADDTALAIFHTISRMMIRKQPAMWTPDKVSDCQD